ncbi:hypothetical protein LPY66_18395 [Dehalobacter sp. DCM]|uniref:hypothetical protein n=1 Tax=Dehalobacter sp. DCM TaxID=2907827 RepID=UPI0030818877|nr:hypothetical protein LPY66_18395 [Dehalobacter sp. DCM]
MLQDAMNLIIDEEPTTYGKLSTIGTLIEELEDKDTRNSVKRNLKRQFKDLADEWGADDVQ